MIHHAKITPADLHKKIRKGDIRVAGNLKLKIYGHLRCWSGRRMHRRNRVFFSSENEACEMGYRPCAHCMPTAYRQWKQEPEPGRIANSASGS